MRPYLFLLIFLLSGIQYLQADIVIISINTDGDDELAFVVTASSGIPSTTTLFFTDDEYDNTTDDWVNATEGRIQLVTSTNLPQGTIVVINPTALTAINPNGGASVGTLTEPDGTFNPSNGVDPIFAYATADNTSGGTITNIFSVFTDGTLVANEDPIPDYPNAIVIELNDDQDNTAYDPANGISFTNVAAFLTAIQNSTNYQSTDGTGDQSIGLPTFYNGLIFSLSSNVPTLSEWGLINLALLLMTMGTLSIVQMRTELE